MANSLCFSPLISFNTAEKPGPVSLHAGRKVNWLSDATYSSRTADFRVLKAADKKSSTKTTSILCTDCEGNGAKKCPQCEGTGVNSVDHFNGQFKAGTLCWLCSTSSLLANLSYKQNLARLLLAGTYAVVQYLAILYWLAVVTSDFLLQVFLWFNLALTTKYITDYLIFTFHRGKKEILCGNCNGAGFMGGFMSTFED
ncbi:UNVERIFIED_CONTAM: Protein BUNDLE SHEATH DEFECTIVE 2, chloroplastic [Sesamum indicum]